MLVKLIEIIWCRYIWFFVKTNKWFYKDKRLAIERAKELSEMLFVLILYQLGCVIIFPIGEIIETKPYIDAIIPMVIALLIQRRINKYLLLRRQTSRIIFNYDYITDKRGVWIFTIFALLSCGGVILLFIPLNNLI